LAQCATRIFFFFIPARRDSAVVFFRLQWKSKPWNVLL